MESPSGRGDRLEARWTPGLCLESDLVGELAGLPLEDSEALREEQQLPLRWECLPGESTGDLFRCLFLSLCLFFGLPDLYRLFLLEPDADLSRLCFFPLFFFFSL